MKIVRLEVKWKLPLVVSDDELSISGKLAPKSPSQKSKPKTKAAKMVSYSIPQKKSTTTRTFAQVFFCSCHPPLPLPQVTRMRSSQYMPLHQSQLQRSRGGALRRDHHLGVLQKPRGPTRGGENHLLVGGFFRIFVGVWNLGRRNIVINCFLCYFGVT